MVDPAEFLNNYSEWHYLWTGIFIGLTVGFALGVWVRHRLRRFVHSDVLQALNLLGVRQDAEGIDRFDARPSRAAGQPQDEGR